MKVYRYMKFKDFQDMVIQKRLYFVNPLICWKDKKEAYLFRAAQEANKNKEIRELLFSHPFSNSMIPQIEKGTIPNEKSPEYLDWFGMRCQSWTLEMSDKMWKEYGDNNSGICVAVEIAKIKQLKYKGNDSHVESLEIEYKEKLCIKEQIQAAVKKNEFYFPQILKYKALNYEFEKEWRFYVSILGINENEWVYSKCGVYIPIEGDIGSFIDEVWTHPDASYDVKSNVEKLCSQYGIKYFND